MPNVALSLGRKAAEVVEVAEVVDNSQRNAKIIVGLLTAAATIAFRSVSPANLESGFGVSMAKSIKEAVAGAVEASLGGINGPPTIAFVSCTIARNVEEVRKEVAAALPKNVPIHGVTSSGAILTKSGTKTGAVRVLLIKSDKKKSFVTAYDYGNGKTAALALQRKMKKP